MRFGVLNEEPLPAAAVRARPLWSLLTAFGIDVGVINWPLTDPAPVVRGDGLSDQYLRRLSTRAAIDDDGIAYPAGLAADIAPLVHGGAASGPAIVPADGSIPLAPEHQQAGRRDRLHDAMARRLAAERPTQLRVVRYESVDVIGHDFLRYALPQAFGDVTDEERRDER